MNNKQCSFCKKPDHSLVSCPDRPNTLTKEFKYVPSHETNILKTFQQVKENNAI